MVVPSNYILLNVVSVIASYSILQNKKMEWKSVRIIASYVRMSYKTHTCTCKIVLLLKGPIIPLFSISWDANKIKIVV